MIIDSGMATTCGLVAACAARSRRSWGWTRCEQLARAAATATQMTELTAGAVDVLAEIESARSQVLTSTSR